MTGVLLGDTTMSTARWLTIRVKFKPVTVKVIVNRTKAMKGYGSLSWRGVEVGSRANFFTMLGMERWKTVYISMELRLEFMFYNDNLRCLTTTFCSTPLICLATLWLATPFSPYCVYKALSSALSFSCCQSPNTNLISYEISIWDIPLLSISSLPTLDTTAIMQCCGKLNL